MNVLANTVYLPPGQYMSEISRASEITIEIMETYRKQTCRNHCSIYGPNGLQTLTIPVIKTNGNHTKTRDIRIAGDQPWQKIHWRSIKTAYNNSPFFLYYGDYFEPFYNRNYNFLVDFNFDLLQKVFTILKIPSILLITSDYRQNPDGMVDLRDKMEIQQPEAKPAPGHYTQVFEPRHGFIPNLSIIDIIFNLGPETAAYLRTAF